MFHQEKSGNPGIYRSIYLFRVHTFYRYLSCWHGIMVIASAYRTEDPGFESRQGVRFFRNFYIAVLLSKLYMLCHCVYVLEKNKCFKNIFLMEKQFTVTVPCSLHCRADPIRRGSMAFPSSLRLRCHRPPASPPRKAKETIEI
jgi:hypothetical protein